MLKSVAISAAEARLEDQNINIDFGRDKVDVPTIHLTQTVIAFGLLSESGESSERTVPSVMRVSSNGTAAERSLYIDHR